MLFMKSVRPRSSQSGYVLLALMLTMTLILIALSVEAPRIAQQIKREKEEELVHRGKDYATAVKRFVHKSGGRYPLSVEQLESTNHIRFLRKKYVDPMTGESNWKMVHVGEAEIKIPAPNPGLSGGGGANPGLFNSAPGGNPPPGTPPTGLTQIQNPPPGQQPNQDGTTGQLGSLTTSGIGNGQTVGGGQIMGVASVSKKQGIKEFNDKDEYDQWYFVYDLRLEQSGGSGITVAAPRGATSATGSSGALGATGSGAPGSPGTPNSQNPGSQNPSDASAQPTPVQTPAPTPTPQN
jgi:type II secretory pathway pseudopilin PulG